MSAKVVNGLIEEMCLLWRKCSQGKYCMYYFEQVLAILGNFRAGMADKCYEEKGQCLDKAR